MTPSDTGGCNSNPQRDRQKSESLVTPSAGAGTDVQEPSCTRWSAGWRVCPEGRPGSACRNQVRRAWRPGSDVPRGLPTPSLGEVTGASCETLTAMLMRPHLKQTGALLRDPLSSEKQQTCWTCGDTDRPLERAAWRQEAPDETESTVHGCSLPRSCNCTTCLLFLLLIVGLITLLNSFL